MKIKRYLYFVHSILMRITAIGEYNSYNKGVRVDIMTIDDEFHAFAKYSGMDSVSVS